MKMAAGYLLIDHPLQEEGRKLEDIRKALEEVKRHPEEEGSGKELLDIVLEEEEET